jgi:hypothetical protein
MKLYLPIAFILCLLALPSCGDDLCSRASDRMNGCSEGGYEDALCWAFRACNECLSEGRAYARCIVDASSCDEIMNTCDDEVMEWSTCMNTQGCY